MTNYVDLLVPETGSYTRPYEPLVWAKTNCSSYITMDIVQRDQKYYYRFRFSNEKDRTLFLLRWS